MQLPFFELAVEPIDDRHLFVLIQRNPTFFNPAAMQTGE
jgi:hypothetical protein